MKLPLHIALLGLPAAVCGQDNDPYVAGHMVEIRGQVLDATNGDTLVFSKLKLLASEVVVGESVADFDGNYRFRFCSNRVKGDSLVVQAEELGYHSKRFVVKAETNLSLTIRLAEDSTFKVTEQSKQEYLHSFYRDRPFCGTEEYERDYESNPMFRHCDGRIEPFRRLIELKEHMDEWERL